MCVHVTHCRSAGIAAKRAQNSPRGIVCLGRTVRVNLQRYCQSVRHTIQALHVLCGVLCDGLAARCVLGTKILETRWFPVVVCRAAACVNKLSRGLNCGASISRMLARVHEVRVRYMVQSSIQSVNCIMPSSRTHENRKPPHSSQEVAPKFHNHHLNDHRVHAGPYR